MTLPHFFKLMEHIHFVFGIPDFPEKLENAIEGVIL